MYAKRGVPSTRWTDQRGSSFEPLVREEKVINDK
jgi:hypothetical protein